MVLIEQAEVFAPKPLGRKDVLIAGGSIIRISDRISITDELLEERIDGSGLKLIPGLIDSHCHIAGAGGEGGPASRTPEMHISDFFEAGVTTAVGCLGTDGMTRSIESVLMKAKALRGEGMTCFIYSGAYQVPTPNILGDAGKDIAMIEEVIGTGEIALSDHRSSFPSTAELARLASQARVGGMLGGKAGIVNIHMGDAADPFRPIHDVVKSTELGYKQFLPTHINRNAYIFEDAKEYGKQGFVDMTSSSWPYYQEYEVKPSRALKMLLEAGVPLEHISMSSDAGGSLPDFDADGKLISLEIGKPLSLMHELRDMVRDDEIPLETALCIVTLNVADILKLSNKSRIEEGMDADLVLIDGEFIVRKVFARGRMVYEG